MTDRRKGPVLASRPAPRRPPVRRTGAIALHPDGFAFLEGDGPSEGSLFLPPGSHDHAMSGDRVEVSVEPGRDGRDVGRVTRVVGRCKRVVVGIARREGKGGRLVPDARQARASFDLEAGGARLTEGHLVAAEVRRYPGDPGGPSARALADLGAPGTPRAETERILYEHDLPRDFPADVLAEAREQPWRRLDARAGRRDDRRILTVTIDGPKSKDFDDALSAEWRPNGDVRLRVSIADVAHHVQRGSAIDREAFHRGTSVYLPDRVLPMLPPVLSDDLCSLNPRVDRLAVTVELDVTPTGELRGPEIHETVIRSAHRLTYGQVHDVLDGRAAPADRDLGELLQTLRAIYGRLRFRRVRRGGLDLDRPEAEVVLEESGEPGSIVLAERNVAHRIVEECMIAANESVAAWLTARRVPGLFRIHGGPTPEKLQELERIAGSFGFATKLGARAHPAAIAALLHEAEGSGREHAIRTSLLPLMGRAEYAARLAPHFALASDAYLHFTSPIRRYADLAVHRQVKAALRSRPAPLGVPDLDASARQCSARSRRAERVEWDVLAVLQAVYMSKRLGETFTAYATGASPAGTFVELEGLAVSGLIPSAGRAPFPIGARLTVRVAAVDPSRGRITFERQESRRPPPRRAKEARG